MRLTAASVFGTVSLVLVVEAGTNDLHIAREALRDGLWEIARTHARADDSTEARLLVLESWAGEGKWENIAHALEDWKSEKGPGFDYYRAVSRGDIKLAMEILAAGGTPEGCVEAEMYAAAVLAKEGDRAGAERLWRDVVSQTNVSARVLVVAGDNLADREVLRRAYSSADSASSRRKAGLRLGALLLKDAKTAEEGERLVRAVVRDSPDAEGAREAFLAMADVLLSRAQWGEALAAFREATDIWPDVGRLPSVLEGRGWALRNLGRSDEAIEEFKRLGELSQTDEMKARSLVLEGDVLQESGRDKESMDCYRTVLDRYSDTAVAKTLKEVVGVRELEAYGRRCYRDLKFAEAMDVFAQVAKADPSRAPQMDYFRVLCLYGQMREDDACQLARGIVDTTTDASVRTRARLWLAKVLYNNHQWKEAEDLFLACEEGQPDSERAAEALLWAARAAFEGGDFSQTVALSGRLVRKYGDSKSKPAALLVQGEALTELSRLDEAILVLNRAMAADGITSDERARAQILKADALYVMGADNPSRYTAALENYRGVRFDGTPSESERLVLSYKIARTLEKLKRLDDAFDQYYAQVVLAYRDGRTAHARFTEEAQACFSRAAFRLADEYENRGRLRQSEGVLRLVVESDVPAAGEAARRIERLTNKERSE